MQLPEWKQTSLGQITRAAMAYVVKGVEVPQRCSLRLHLTLEAQKCFQQGKLSKILQVSHSHLGFSPDKNNNEIIHSHRVLLEILDPDLENTNETL